MEVLESEQRLAELPQDVWDTILTFAAAPLQVQMCASRDSRPCRFQLATIERIELLSHSVFLCRAMQKPLSPAAIRGGVQHNQSRVRAWLHLVLVCKGCGQQTCSGFL